MTATGTAPVHTGILHVNGTGLYHEVRGTGPALLCISGAFGDAGYWISTADALSGEYTVVAYDRRGNSRSPRPDGMSGTTVAEQADDAAALLEALRLGPAIILGSSAGAVIALDLAARHPHVVRKALVHEPPLLTVAPDGAEFGAQVQAMVEQGFAEGGPARAAELFIHANAGEETAEALDPALRDRIVANAETFFGSEVESFTGYRPDVDAVRAAGVPMIALGGVDSRGHPVSAARWVSATVGCPYAEVPGAHVPYLSCPDEFALALRQMLER